ncbi:MAG: hypothetical protein IT169_06230 [Bryobacterales bacterium]|nr:hypothetical protein [Bryobacterales bacterium]
MRKPFLFSTLILLALPLFAASVTPESAAAFQAYDRKVEQEIRARIGAGQVVALRERVKRNGGKAIVQSGAEPNPNDTGSAYIHDWLGAIFIPGGAAAGVKAVLQDFGRHKEYYQPEVIDSKLLSKNGDVFHSALRLRKKKVLTVILSSEYTTRFTDLSPRAGYSIARSTKMSEVENPGTPGERELPPGEGQGFLWNLNSFWSWEEGEGGVYVECRAISLSRDVPTGLGWIVNPIIRDLPKESLEATLLNTRKAVLALQKR